MEKTSLVVVTFKSDLMGKKTKEVNYRNSKLKTSLFIVVIFPQILLKESYNGKRESKDKIYNEVSYSFLNLIAR